MDTVQQKLRQIDEQLAQKSILEKIASAPPLLIPAIGLMAGILIQDSIAKHTGLSSHQVSGWIWMIPLVICISIVLVIRHKDKNLISNSHTEMILGLAIFLCFVCLGATCLWSFNNYKANDIRNCVNQERVLATVRGKIVTEPKLSANSQWSFAGFMHSDPSSSFYMDITEAETKNGWAKAFGRIYVSVGEPVVDLKPGDYIQTYCWLNRIKPPINPGQFNMAKYLAHKNVFVAASINTRDSIDLLAITRKSFLSNIKQNIRQTALQALLDDSVVGEQNRGLLLGLKNEPTKKRFSWFQC